MDIEGWEDKTCETCRFRFGSQCRKNPPCIDSPYINRPDYYPYIVVIEAGKELYQDACSFYEKKD